MLRERENRTEDRVLPLTRQEFQEGVGRLPTFLEAVLDTVERVLNPSDEADN